VDTAILPLAITMMAGPQILSALLFVTGRNPVGTSVAFVTAVALGASAMVMVGMLVAGAVSGSVELRESSEPTTAAKVIQAVLIGLLILGSVKSYLGRETAEPPKWLGKLQEAGPMTAFGVGFLLISLFPSDFVITMTTGIQLEAEGKSFTEALPFIGLTTAIAALPFGFYLLFRRRAEAAIPKARDWMNANSWLVNIFVYLLFIALILS
jgi:hypothetical protein